MIRKHRGAVAALVITSLWTLACGKGGPREAGPNEDEYGDVLFWDVVEIDQEEIDCPDGVELEGENPFFEGGTVAYRISDDGERATLLDCTSYDADDCKEVAGPDFTIDGHEMNLLVGVDQLASLRDCALIETNALLFTDEGETAVMEAVIKHSFEGNDNDCDELSAAYEDSNGVSLDTCVGIYSADLVFAEHDPF